MNDTLLHRGLDKLKDLKKENCFIVGGYIRNRLLGLDNKDADIVSDEKDLPVRLARAVDGDYFKLKEGLFQRVLKGGVSWDFTPLGGDVEKNLAGRDFCCDAMALRVEYAGLKNIKKKIIDPFSGIEDIGKKQISPVTETIFRDDEVRILRAFRLKGETPMKLSRSVKELISRDSGLLGSAKGERLWEEFKKICQTGESRGLIEDLSRRAIPASVYGFPGGSRRVEETLKIMKRSEVFPGENLPADPLFSAASLWRDKGITNRLRFSNREKDMFSEYVSPSRDFFACWISRGAAALRIFKARYSLSGHVEFLEKIEKNAEKIKNIKPRSLLSGDEIMEKTGIGSSPRIGEIKENLLKEQFEGRIKTREEAKDFVNNFIE